MTKKIKQDIEIFISDCIGEFTPILNLQGHDIKPKYDEDTGYLGMQFRYPYVDAYLFYGDRAKVMFDEGKMDRREILHELIHVITDPLYAKSTSRFVSKDDIECERELLTDRLTTIIHRLVGNL